MLLERNQFDETAAMLRALGHPLRLRIAAILDREPTHVGAMAQSLGAPQAIVSQQLRILRMSGLVAVTRTGGQAVYRLVRPEVSKLLRCMENHPLECEAL